MLGEPEDIEGSHSLHRGDPNILTLDGMRLAHAETWG
jgi:hypothetical protein